MRNRPRATRSGRSACSSPWPCTGVRTTDAAPSACYRNHAQSSIPAKAPLARCSVLRSLAATPHYLQPSRSRYGRQHGVRRGSARRVAQTGRGQGRTQSPAQDCRSYSRALAEVGDVLRVAELGDDVNGIAIVCLVGGESAPQLCRRREASTPYAMAGSCYFDLRSQMNSALPTGFSVDAQFPCGG